MSSFEIPTKPNVDAPQHRPSAVIGHPYIGRGGSEAVMMWLIQALKDDHNLTVLTTGGWNLEELNSCYGTQIGEEQVKVRIASIPWLVRNQSVAALRGACYQRAARQIAGDYDLRISAYNPTDWGLPALHFIADFSWLPEIRERLDPPAPGFVYRDSWLRRKYLAYAASHANPSGRDVLRDDRVIANSQWTATLIRNFCGVECSAVVYPPVWIEFPDLPWKDKEQAFVMIGRIAPEKQIERAVAILRAVRQRGHAILLHLCGQIGNDPYGQKIARLCEKNGDWIIPEGHVSGARKAGILARCRYGIQTRSAEPFGISVAEMIKAGAIVFAPCNGGQEEILDHPSLLFAHTDEAVEKICATIASTDQEERLRTHLDARTARFSSDAFVSHARDCISANEEVHV